MGPEHFRKMGHVELPRPVATREGYRALSYYEAA